MIRDHLRRRLSGAEQLETRDREIDRLREEIHRLWARHTELGIGAQPRGTINVDQGQQAVINIEREEIKANIMEQLAMSNRPGLSRDQVREHWREFARLQEELRRLSCRERQLEDQEVISLVDDSSNEDDDSDEEYVP